MKEELESVKTTLHARLTSPFTGSFIVSWLVVNWKIVLAFLSSEKYSNKVAHIEHICELHGWAYLFFWPLGVALFYVFLYQFFLGVTQWGWIQGSNFNKKMQEKKLYTHKEVEEKIKRLDDIIDSKDRVVESSRREAEIQKGIADDAVARLVEKEKQFSAAEEQLSELNKIVFTIEASLVKNEKQLEENDKSLLEQKKAMTNTTKKLSVLKKERDNLIKEKQFKGNKNKEKKFFMDCKNEYIREARKFVSFGGNINASNSKGNTALHYACAHGKLKIVKMLLGNSAEINKKNSDNNTPLDYASKGGYFEIAELLKEKGAILGSGTLIIDKL